MSQDHPSLARQFSRRIVAEALLHQAPISRADLARVTGLSKQTMSQVIGELEAGGWVKSAGTSRGGVGRTAVTYEIAEDAAYSLGVDLGGTKVTAAVADLVGKVVGDLTEPTDPRGGRHVLDQIHGLAAKLAASAAIDAARIESIVIGTPGVVDPRSGRIGLIPNIRGLSELDVPQVLGSLFGRAVHLENDVNLAMLGEAWRGGAQGCRNAAFLALGTGVGLGLVVNGELVRGATGAAGEVAYLPLGADTTSPEARSVGSFELEVGSAGILRRYRACGGEGADTVRDIFARLAQGEPQAAAVLDDTAHIVALAIAALQATVDLERIVLGGSIGVQPELVERVQRAMPSVFARPVDIRPSALGSAAGLVGAVSSAVHRLHNQRFGIPDMPGDFTIPGSSLARAAE
ncbi:ROK family transcriptional regulator [Labrys monachus]|uniref:NBD/HSP70 family sugar kinase n=1 Tax=Labrys monachus TaxID=217067 RepID=A0ABU0F888_9HYPH|nr:ROK family transcriptional regulator [Labrys monachus]MDQ0390587.1 putative NBD/HSP70 family sugar kinase [Labrys monachus]